MVSKEEKLVKQFYPPQTDLASVGDSFVLPNYSGLSDAQAKTNMAYGSAGADDITKTVTISQAEVYYPITSFGLTEGYSKNMVFGDTSYFTISKGGKYLVNWTATLKCATANQNVSMAVMVNSTPIVITEGSGKLTTANDAKCVSGTGILNLSVGDVVKMCLENETGANNLIVTHFSISLLRIE